MVCIHLVVTRLHIDDQDLASVVCFHFRPYLLFIERFTTLHDLRWVNIHSLIVALGTR